MCASAMSFNLIMYHVITNYLDMTKLYDIKNNKSLRESEII